MYSIYHIPGVKIGCSKRVEQRVKEQGYKKYELLEVYHDINKASEREKELQKEYGYIEKNVKTDYKQQIEFAKFGRLAQMGKPNKGSQTQIKNKIGIFGYSKEERLELNTKANIIRAKISAEKRKKPILVYKFNNNEFVGEWNSIKEASIELKATNLKSTISGERNHSKGYYAKLKNK